MRLFATGFGPFHDVGENPSAVLAQESGLPFAVLPVTFAGVDQFLDSFPIEEWDGILMMGVAQGRSQFGLEHVGRNWIGELEDAAGVRAGPGPIDPRLPNQIGATLWTPETSQLNPELLLDSVDAGSYLCNYALFRALCRFPAALIGFLHVPPFEAVSQGEQQSLVGRIVEACLEFGANRLG